MTIISFIDIQYICFDQPNQLAIRRKCTFSKEKENQRKSRNTQHTTDTLPDYRTRLCRQWCRLSKSLSFSTLTLCNATHETRTLPKVSRLLLENHLTGKGLLYIFSLPRKYNKFIQSDKLFEIKCAVLSNLFSA